MGSKRATHSVVLKRPIGRPRKAPAPERPKRPTGYELENMRYFAALRGDPEPPECRMVECDACEGHGTEHCDSCEGEGTIPCTCSECGDDHDAECDDCHGKGHRGECRKCLGAGEVDDEAEPAPAPPASLPLPYCYWVTR